MIVGVLLGVLVGVEFGVLLGVSVGVAVGVSVGVSIADLFSCCCLVGVFFRGAGTGLLPGLETTAGLFVGLNCCGIAAMPMFMTALASKADVKLVGP